MKALVIAPQPFFSPRGTPFSVYYRTLVTSEMGVDVDLLTYGEGMDVDIPNVNIIRIPCFKFLDNVKIGPSFLKLFLDAFIVFWTFFLLLRNKYDFVHAHEESIFFCVFLKPLFNFRLIYDMHSSLPQQLTNFKFTTSKVIIGIFKWLEDQSIQRSDAVITICPDLADYVNAVIKDRNKHVLIENSIFDTVKLKKRGGTENCALSASENGELALPADRRLVVYAGTLEPYQGIDLLIRSFRLVRERVADALLLIVGGSPEQVAHYSALAHDEGLEGLVVLTGQVPQPQAKEYCTRAAVQTSPRSSGTNTPLKIYQQLASGVPLVATNIYSHTQVLDDSVAFLVEPTAEGLASGIIKALEEEQRAESVALQAQQLYEENYSRPVYVEKLKRVLSLIKG
ncbi:MAG: glycosyltransferase family 4 protein [Desulfuromonadales bacterium]|nr:glycosyltransferase family 4 protein [Desulfuromonadales bacterium]